MTPPAFEVWLPGLASGAAQVAVGELAAALHGTHTSPLRATGKWLIDALPTPVIDIGVALLRRADKPVIAASLVVASVGLPALTSLAGRTALIASLLLLGGLGLCALWRRVELSRGAALAIASSAVVAGLTGMVQSVAASLGLALVATVSAMLVRRLRLRVAEARRTRVVLPAPSIRLPPLACLRGLDVPGLSDLFTPVDRFFVTDVNFPSPDVDLSSWTLSVHGLVSDPLELSFADVLAMPAHEMDAVLMCVHNPVGGPFVGNARWQGVPLRDVLARAGVRGEADHLRFHAVDGFSAGMSLSLLEQGFAPLIVYAMNGEPLDRGHGAPVRMIVPGLHGYDANIKWLASVEVTRFPDAVDYAERKGWPRRPSCMAPNARIDVPTHTAVLQRGPRVIAGVAWNPPHGVARVELRVDGGEWRSCDVAHTLGPSAWVQWQAQWDAPSGRHALEVRACGRDGTQVGAPSAPYPDGATGYHRVTVDVLPGRVPRSRQAVWWLASQAGARWELARAGVRAWRRHRTQ